MKRISIILLLLAFTLAPQAQTRSKRTTTTRKTAVQPKKSPKKKTTTKTTTQPASVQALQNQRQKLQQQIKEQEKKLRTNQQDVKNRLQNLMIINTEIEGKRRTIDTIRRNISELDVEIDSLCQQLETCATCIVTSRTRVS